MIQEILILKSIDAISSLFGTQVSREQITIERTISNFREQGDYSLVVFPLLKITRKSPEETARLIGEKLLEITDQLESFSVIKGFLNLKVKPSYWSKFILENYNNENFGIKEKNNESPVVIEFSSPNTNKPLHLGHIRNNLLGWSISRILEASGKNVKRVNLVNDRGIHICKSMLAWKIYGNGINPQEAGKKGDKLVGDFYVLFDKKYKEELVQLRNEGLSDDQAASKSRLMAQARQLLLDWERKDDETRSLWDKMNQWVYSGFDITYKSLGISFDKIYYESETYLLGKEIVEEGLKSGILKRKDDNSVWIDLTPDGLDEKLLLRSDGTSVYMTQDLGTAQLRYDEFNPQSMIYVVGNEQNYHFNVLKLVLQKIGKQWAEKIYHLSYGMVELPEGKMKSREGTVVDADDLIDEMLITAKEMTLELGKIEDFENTEAQELYRKVGLGALKYFILKVDPKKNMVFNPAESIDFNGNTGPFIQYTYARIKSVLRKAAGLSRSFDSTIDLHHKEAGLAILNYTFPQVLKQAADEYSPSVIANYLFELAREYNQFYHELTILKEENENKRCFRLALSQLTAQNIRNGMDLLGIEVPERM